MIVDNPITEDERIQSLGMKFNSIVQETKLIIQATCEGDNSQYTGKVIQNEHLSFNQVLEHLENRTFRILSKNQDFLKLEIMHQEVILYSILKLELNELKETTKALNQRQEEFRLMIHAQIDEINKIKDEIRKMEIKELKDDVKKLIESQEEFRMIVQSQNDSVYDLKDETKKFKLEIKRTVEEIKKINENSLKSEIMKIMAEINEVKNQINENIETLNIDWKTKLNEQEEKMKKNSEEEIEKMMKEIEKKSNFIGIKVEKKLIEQNAKDEKISESQKEEEKKSEKIINEAEEKPQEIEYKWSEQLKSGQITIKGNVAKITKYTGYREFCLLNVSLANTIRENQSWKIKIKKMRKWIELGICLKSEMLYYNFNSQNINWWNPGHGLYMIGSGGWCYSHTENEFNNVDKSFKFDVNDVILIEYDPINSKLSFSKNNHKEYFEMSVIDPPENDAYYPCVSFGRDSNEVELIQEK